jgi:hypothetical protein
LDIASDVLVTQKLQAVLVAMKPYVIGSILQPLDIRWYISPYSHLATTHQVDIALSAMYFLIIMF